MIIDQTCAFACLAKLENFRGRRDLCSNRDYISMDLEKQSHHDTKDNATSSHDPLSLRTTIDPDVDPGEVQVTMIRQRYNILRFLRNCETWVDSKMNFEAMGVERVPEHMRKPPQILNVSDSIRWTESLAEIRTTE